MGDIKVAELVKKTGFGSRYWQKKIARGEIPGAKYVECGSRRIFLIDETLFDEYWKKQQVDICQRTLLNETKRGGIGLSTPQNYTRVHLRQTNSQSLKTALREYSKS